MATDFAEKSEKAKVFSKVKFNKYLNENLDRDVEKVKVVQYAGKPGEPPKFGMRKYEIDPVTGDRTDKGVFARIGKAIQGETLAETELNLREVVNTKNPDMVFFEGETIPVVCLPIESMIITTESDIWF